MEDAWIARRSEKERSVEGHGGSSVQEVAAIAALVPFDLCLGSLLLSVWERRLGWGTHASRELLELFLGFFPTLLVYLGFMEVSSTFLFHAIFFCLWMVMYPTSNKDTILEKVEKSDRTHFLSAYRASMMIASCIAILAVDFPAFPRRFVKVENYGYGLMDVGVGSFVLATAFVSSIAKGEPRHVKTEICIASKKASILMIFGIVRLVITRAIDYQLHVGEYGVHWNFFFTQAILSFVPVVFKGLADHAMLAGAIVTGLHQFLLMRSNGILNSYIHAHARSSSLVDMNKEGIFSLPGYTGLYLIGAGISHTFHFSSLSSKPSKKQIRRLLGMTAGLWLCFLQADRALEPASRRSCNATYVVWMLAFNSSMLLLFFLATCYMSVRRIHLLEAINRHLIRVFLVANVLTGIVNISVNTLGAGKWLSLGIVSFYSAAFCLMGTRKALSL